MKWIPGLLLVLMAALCPLTVTSDKAASDGVAESGLSPAMAAIDSVSDEHDDIAPTSDRGIRLFGDALEYYQACARIEKRNRGRIDMSQYMRHTAAYEQLLAKLNNVDRLLSLNDSSLIQANVHVPGTLIWFDALLSGAPQLDYYIRSVLDAYDGLVRKNRGQGFWALKHQLLQLKGYVKDCAERGVAVRSFDVKEMLRSTTRAWANAKKNANNYKGKSKHEKELLAQRFNAIKRLLEEIYNNLDSSTEAVLTIRVFVHPHSKHSEVEEGIRRIDKQIRGIVKVLSSETVRDKLESSNKIHHVSLCFDTRGHKEIYKFIRSQRDYVESETQGFVRIAFVEDLEHSMGGNAGFDNIRDRLKLLFNKYKNGKDQEVIRLFDVVYAHFVGVLFEMQGVEFLKYSMGYDLLAHGMEIYDTDNDTFVTELDAVLKDTVISGTRQEPAYAICEIRSCRTMLQFETFLEERFYYKPEGFSSKKDFINSRLRELAKDEKAEFSEVLFMLDVGYNTEFIDKLIAMEPEFSRKYGFKVKFLFLSSSSSGLSIAHRHNLEMVEFLPDAEYFSDAAAADFIVSAA